MPPLTRRQLKLTGRDLPPLFSLDSTRTPVQVTYGAVLALDDPTFRERRPRREFCRALSLQDAAESSRVKCSRLRLGAGIVHVDVPLCLVPHFVQIKKKTPLSKPAGTMHAFILTVYSWKEIDNECRLPFSSSQSTSREHLHHGMERIAMERGAMSTVERRASIEHEHWSQFACNNRARMKVANYCTELLRTLICRLIFREWSAVKTTTCFPIMQLLPARAVIPDDNNNLLMAFCDDGRVFPPSRSPSN